MFFDVPMTSNIIEIRILVVVKAPNKRILFWCICVLVVVLILGIDDKKMYMHACMVSVSVDQTEGQSNAQCKAIHIATRIK